MALFQRYVNSTIQAMAVQQKIQEAQTHEEHNWNAGSSFLIHTTTVI
jgi:hypothetical protein